MIVHGKTEKVTILGAGVGIGNGGDDFDWVIPGRFTPKRVPSTAQVKPAFPHLRGGALLVEKSESASALIYWNGERYLWSQQCD